MTSSTERRMNFRASAMVALGVLIGVLASSPLALTMTPPFSYMALSFCAGLGGFIGFLRRSSIGFFYFMLIAALILASTISKSFVTSTP